MLRMILSPDSPSLISGSQSRFHPDSNPDPDPAQITYNKN